MKVTLACVLLFLVAFSAARSTGGGADGQLQADGGNDEAAFKETVMENKPAAATGEFQDREWDTEGKDGKGGSAIILSNRNQLEALQAKLKNATEEALKEKKEREARRAQEDAQKEKEAETMKQHLSKADKASEEALKERERSHCPPPALHNMYYSFQSRDDPTAYLAVSQTGQARVTRLESREDEQEATFLLTPGLATERYVSLQSYRWPDYYLTHKNWEMQLSHVTKSHSMKNEATFILEKGLIGCQDGYVSFESNSPGTFIQNVDGKVFVKSAYGEGANPAVHSSWRPVVSKVDTFFQVKLKPFAPQKSNIVAEHHQIRNTGEYSYMFWVKPNSVREHWSNLIHKGSTNRDRNPAVWFYPGSTRLHVRSAKSEGSNEGADPETPLAVGTWTHVAVTHSKEGDLAVYVAGNKAASGHIGKPNMNTGPLYASNPWYEPADCEMADLRYYHRVATEDEIRKAVDDSLH